MQILKIHTVGVYLEAGDLAVGSGGDGGDGDVAPAQQSHLLALLVGRRILLVHQHLQTCICVCIYVC